MTNISLLFFFGYLAVSLYYLIDSAHPSERCGEKYQTAKKRSSCAKPLLSSFVGKTGNTKGRDHRLVLELWTEIDVAGTSDHHHHHHHLQWKLSSTCPPMQIDLSPKIFEKLKFGGKGGNCTLEFPRFSRVRGEESDRRHNHRSLADADANKTIHIPTIYKGKFVLKYIGNDSEKKDIGSSASDENSIVLAQTNFDLTRLLEQRNHIQVPFFKYYKQPVVLRLVMDDQLYPIHRPVRGDGLVLKLYHAGTSHGKVYHLPTFYVDDVALKYSSQVQLAPPEDEKVHGPRPPTSLSIQLSIISPQRHVFHRQLEIGFSMLENILNVNELDEIRHMISDEYIYRFILTQIITMIHIYLDYMAFRDEVSFYVGKKSMAGISFSSVLGRFICQFIIFLYLCDGGNTSWLVLGSIGSGVLVELWKVFKFVKPKRVKSFPFVVFSKDLQLMSQLEKDTVNYDAISRTYLCL